MPFDELVQLSKRPKRAKLGERGCAHCTLDKLDGVNKIMGTVDGKEILIVGQSPGQNENRQRKEFVGDSGEFLWTELAAVGIHRRDVDIFNVVRCLPADMTEGSYNSYLKMRSPTPLEIHCCSIHTEQTMPKVKARHILILGQVAQKAFLQVRSVPQQKIFWSEAHRAKIYLADHPSFFIRGYGAGARIEAFRSTLKQLAADWKSADGEAQIDDFAYLREQKYHLISTAKRAAWAGRIIKAYAKSGRRIAVDIEYDIIDERPVIFAIGFCPKPGMSFTYVFDYPGMLNQTDADAKACWGWARVLLENASILKVFHYGCSDIDMLKRARVEVRGYDWDTNYSEYLYYPDEHNKYGLANIAERRFQQFSGYKSIIFPDLFDAMPDAVKVPAAIRTASYDKKEEWMKKHDGFHLSRLKPETLRLYNGADCHLTKLIEIDNKKKVPHALVKLYMDLGFILRAMESNGPLFDRWQHARVRRVWPYRAAQALKNVRDEIGDPEFNPGSPQQVFWAVYEHYEMTYPLRKGKPNTQKKTMMMLSRKHPFPGLVLDWRKLSKAVTTYIDGPYEIARTHNWRVVTVWWACMPAGELVLTDRGYLPVERVRKGDLVLSHTGAAQRVLRTVFNGTCPIIRVTLANGMGLRTTENHQYQLADGSWRRADCLEPGDCIRTYGSKELWKTVKRFPAYEVSSWGRVRRKGSGRIRSLSKQDYGRLQVTLAPGDVGCRVHRLVADAFLPEPCAGVHEVCHRDGYAWDNVAENLYWGSSADNHCDSERHGSLRKLALSDVATAEIRHARQYWGVQTYLAHKFGVSRETVKDIRNGLYRTACVVGKDASVQFGTSVVDRIEWLAPQPTFGLDVDCDHSHVTGGVVTHNTGTATGRLSSSGGDDGGMNLQNLHKNEQLQNLYVADLRWREVFAAIRDIIKDHPVWAAYDAYKDGVDAENVKRKKRGLEAIKPDPPSAAVQADWEVLCKEIEEWVRANMPDLKTFLMLDYGQLEIRVLAQISKDRRLRKDCEGSDIHSAVGSRMTGWSVEQIVNDDKIRTLTKNVHFGIVYLIAKKNLFDFIKAMNPDFNGTEEEISEQVDRYFAAYTGVAAYLESQQDLAQEQGFVETLFGLHRALNVTDHRGAFEEEDDFVDDSGERQTSWRSQAVNTPVQGTGHQLLVCGIVNLRRKPDEYAILGVPCLDVHDAMYFMVNVLDLPEAHDKAMRLFEKESLETVKSDFPHIDWQVPIVADAKAGIRLGGRVKLKAGKFTPGLFLLDWYNVTKKQLEDLKGQLAEVREQ